MPGKGKSKGKKKQKKSNNCRGTEQQEGMPAQICGANDENILPVPVKDDTLATEFSSILDDFKNNNKVKLLPVEQYRGGSRGKDIVKSLLQAAIKRGDQEEVRRGSDEGGEKVGDENTPDEDLKKGDEAGLEGEMQDCQQYQYIEICIGLP